MRTLLIFGGLVVCVLLVTPSDGDRTECQDGGENCPGGDSFDITADDEMKSMDSEDLTVPAEPSESPIMEITTKRPCCRWRITPHCKKCPGLNGPFSRLPPDDITADDEKKSMDSEDLTVPAEPSEIPIMETTTKLPCCRVPKKEPCQRCTGLNGPFGKLPSDDITADDQKKSMDSGDLTVPAEPGERNGKQLPCCRWPKMGPCKRCPGGGTDIWNPDERSHHRR